MTEPKEKGKEETTSIPAFMVGIDNIIDMVPDAETPEKAMTLTRADWSWNENRET